MRIKFDVYLAGSMHGRNGTIVLYERRVASTICESFGLTYYDPSEDEAINPREIIDPKPSLKTMRNFVRKDFKNLDQCRAILVLTGDISSAGTAWEMARMYFKLKRPIILVAPKMAAGELTNFSTVLATKICETQRQAIEWLQRRLK